MNPRYETDSILTITLEKTGILLNMAEARGDIITPLKRALAICTDAMMFKNDSRDDLNGMVNDSIGLMLLSALIDEMDTMYDTPEKQLELIKVIRGSIEKGLEAHRDGLQS